MYSGSRALIPLPIDLPIRLCSTRIFISHRNNAINGRACVRWWLTLVWTGSNAAVLYFFYHHRWRVLQIERLSLSQSIRQRRAIKDRTDKKLAFVYFTPNVFHIPKICSLPIIIQTKSFTAQHQWDRVQESILIFVHIASGWTVAGDSIGNILSILNCGNYKAGSQRSTFIGMRINVGKSTYLPRLPVTCNRIA